MRRPTARAFYPGDCRRELVAFTSGFEPPAELTGPLAGAILPHGGWMYYGRVAARTLASLAAISTPVTVVIFGGVHVPLGANPLYPAGRWDTPLGDLEVDAEAGQAILRGAGDHLRPDSEAHRYEHSLEVLTPMVKYFSLPPEEVVGAPGIESHRDKTSYSIGLDLDAMVKLRDDKAAGLLFQAAVKEPGCKRIFIMEDQLDDTIGQDALGRDGWA